MESLSIFAASFKSFSKALATLHMGKYKFPVIRQFILGSRLVKESGELGRVTVICDICVYIFRAREYTYSLPPLFYKQKLDK